MSIRKRNVVDFPDIFHYAKEKFGVSWNEANDIFFRQEVLRYKGSNDLELWEMDEHDLPEEYDPTDTKPGRAWFILRQFMLDNKLKKLLVIND